MRNFFTSIIFFILIQFFVYVVYFFTGMDDIKILLSFIVLALLMLNIFVFNFGKELISKLSQVEKNADNSEKSTNL